MIQKINTFSCKNKMLLSIADTRRPSAQYRYRSSTTQLRHNYDIATNQPIVKLFINYDIATPPFSSTGWNYLYLHIKRNKPLRADNGPGYYSNYKNDNPTYSRIFLFMVV